MNMVEKVARAICEWQARSWGAADIEARDRWRGMARAAIEAMDLEQLISAAYVRGVEWNEENPLDREYRFKASLDYADKTLFAALSEESTS